jgi:hypothetical protein
MFVIVCLLRAAPAAYGGFWVKQQCVIPGAVASIDTIRVNEKTDVRYRSRGSGYAGILSFASGFAGFILFFGGGVTFGLLAIPAIGFGILGLRPKAKRKGLARAGIFFGLLMILLFLIRLLTGIF